MPASVLPSLATGLSTIYLIVVRVKGAAPVVRHGRTSAVCARLARALGVGLRLFGTLADSLSVARAAQGGTEVSIRFDSGRLRAT
jgi:hypothetical protein